MLPPTSVAILELLAEEFSETEIASYLGLEEESVTNIVKTLMSETNSISTISLLKEAIKRGWIS